MTKGLVLLLGAFCMKAAAFVPSISSNAAQRVALEGASRQQHAAMHTVRPTSMKQETSSSVAALAAATGAGVALVAAALHRSAREETSRVAMSAHKKPTKKGRKIIILECVEQKQMVRDGVPGAGGPRGGVSRFYTEKNVRNTPAPLELKKFNKYLGRHTLHREIKK
eukprot:TRINITY_DN2618_c0_g3_i1.p2 TRINITY_DN2618_c0_g3~~TRINITY_DN2618_c0_g3_i1.p2  ORF type:complete len:167 (+),score=48.44 TRINITY_DN2618_c0_g3_i1:74-574(+)